MTGFAWKGLGNPFYYNPVASF